MDSNARTCASAIILQQDVITRRMLRSGPRDGTLVSSEPTIDQPYVCCCSTLILDLQATSQASNKTQRAGVRVFRISLACASAPYESAQAEASQGAVKRVIFLLLPTSLHWPAP